MVLLYELRTTDLTEVRCFSVTQWNFPGAFLATLEDMRIAKWFRFAVIIFKQLGGTKH